MPEIQLIGYIKLLAENEVDYLIVGGVGGRIQGSGSTTQDLDIMPNPDPENLKRLARALSSAVTRKKEMNSTAYVAHDTVDANEFKTETVLNFDTGLGGIDVLMELPGVGTFDAVRPSAKRYEFEGIVLVVADIDASS
jgi:hypothetical protein